MASIYLTVGCHKSSSCNFTLSAKYNIVKYNKMRYACIGEQFLEKSEELQGTERCYVLKIHLL